MAEAKQRRALLPCNTANCILENINGQACFIYCTDIGGQAMSSESIGSLESARSLASER